MTVTYLPEAYTDLDEIFEFVAGHSPAYGQRLIDQITLLADGLWRFPHRHEAIPLLPTDDRVIRRLPVRKHYLIIYRVDDDREEVVILGVFATRRDPAGLDEILGRR